MSGYLRLLGGGGVSGGVPQRVKCQCLDAHLRFPKPYNTSSNVYRLFAWPLGLLYLPPCNCHQQSSQPEDDSFLLIRIPRCCGKHPAHGSLEHQRTGIASSTGPRRTAYPGTAYHQDLSLPCATSADHMNTLNGLFVAANPSERLLDLIRSIVALCAGSLASLRGDTTGGPKLAWASACLRILCNVLAKPCTLDGIRDHNKSEERPVAS